MSDQALKRAQEILDEYDHPMCPRDEDDIRYLARELAETLRTLIATQLDQPEDTLEAHYQQDT